MAYDVSGLLAGLDTRGSTRAEQLAAVIEERIRTTGQAPGSMIGTLDEIRRESGLARATVSEAVRLLRDRGVLVVRPGRGGGLFVAEQSPVVRMRHTLLAVREDPSSLADAIELRNHLEELIDIGAARSRSELDVAALRGCLEVMATAPDWDSFLRANWALHERIAQLCPNAMARAVYLSTLGYLSASTASASDTGDKAVAYRAERLEIHTELVDAIEAGDETAVRTAVSRHNTTD